jgi:hypothetical protein
VQSSRSRRKERKKAIIAVVSVEKWARWTSCPLFHRPFRVKNRKTRSNFNTTSTTKSPLKKMGLKSEKSERGKELLEQVIFR